jgi:hypothetical protein
MMMSWSKIVSRVRDHARKIVALRHAVAVTVGAGVLASFFMLALSAPLPVMSTASAQNRPLGAWLVARVGGDVRVRTAADPRGTATKQEDLLAPSSEIETGGDGPTAR